MPVFDIPRVQNCWLTSMKKRSHNGHSFCIYMFSNNVDFKTNKQKLQEIILNFMCARIAAVKLFQVDLDKL